MHQCYKMAVGNMEHVTRVANDNDKIPTIIPEFAGFLTSKTSTDIENAKWWLWTAGVNYQASRSNIGNESFIVTSPQMQQVKLLSPRLNHL